MEPKVGVKYWCWWRSRYLWYTGKKYRGDYVFEDVAGALIEVSTTQMEMLEVKEERHGKEV